MSKIRNRQDAILAKLRETRQVVTLIITNGFQMKGRITGFDQDVIVVESNATQQIVYKHAVSTILPARPLDLDGLGEEGA